MGEEQSTPPLADDVQRAIDEHPEAVEDYKDGDDGAVNFLVGQVLQARGGSADPGEVNRVLKEKLETDGEGGE